MWKNDDGGDDDGMPCNNSRSDNDWILWRNVHFDNVEYAVAEHVMENDL